MSVSAVASKVMIVHNKLFKIGAAGSIIGGVFGVFDTYRYTMSNKNIGCFNLVLNAASTIGAGMILGFGAGYGSPIVIPMVIYEGVKNSQ